MPVLVVDALETVEIDHQNGEAPAVALAAGPRLPQVFLERAAIEQPGQRVMSRQEVELLATLVAEMPLRGGQPVDAQQHDRRHAEHTELRDRNGTFGSHRQVQRIHADPDAQNRGQHPEERGPHPQHVGRGHHQKDRKVGAHRIDVPDVKTDA